MSSLPRAVILDCQELSMSGISLLALSVLGTHAPLVWAVLVSGALAWRYLSGVFLVGLLFHISCRCSLWRCMRLFFHGSFNLGTLRHCCLFVRNLFLELSKTFRSTCFPGHEAQSYNMRCIGDLVRNLFKSTNSRRCEAIQSLIGRYKGDSLS